MLTFIKNKALKKTIEDSIEYMNIIFANAKENSTTVYKEETYRVIILYVVAVIEAVLLYVLKERGEEIISITYKDPRIISEKLKHEDFPKGKLIAAIQCKEKKKAQQIGVQDLIKFMQKKKLMASDTAEGVLDINNIRNTFHLNKDRVDIQLEVKKVEKAFSLLHKIIKGAPKAISKKG